MKRPLFNLSLLFSLGIFIAHFVSYRVSLGLLLGSLLIVCSFLFVQKAARLTGMIYLLFFFLGIAIYTLNVYFPSSDRIDRFAFLKNNIQLRGDITEFVQISERTETILNATHILDDEGLWHPCRGKVLLKHDMTPSSLLEEFDHIEVRGKILDFPFVYFKDQKNFRGWLRAKEIAVVIQVSNPQDFKRIEKFELGFFERLLKISKSWCSQNLSKGFSKDSQARGLLLAMILGTRADLDPSVKSSFLYTNTIHILSISGLHLTVILMGILFVLGLFSMSRRWTYAITLVAIWIYAWMTGLSIPIYRSAIMATFFLAGGLIRKKVDLANSLGASALFILILNPFSLFDPGFQLSYLCLISLLFLTPHIEKDLEFLQWVPADMISVLSSARERFFARSVQWLLKILSGSLAVWIGVLPVIAYHFHVFSPVTVLANLVAVPLVGVIMNVGFATCILGFADWIAHSLNAVNDVLLIFLMRVVEGFSRIPAAYFFVQVPVWGWALIYYGIVFIGVLWTTPKMKCSYFLCASLIFVPLLFPVRGKDFLSIHLVSGPPTQAKMIEWPDGHRTLWLKNQEKSSRISSVDRLKMTLGIRGVDHIFLNTNEIEVVEDIDNFLGSKAVNASIDEMLQDQKIHIGLSKESDLGLIRYKEIWVKWIDSQEINSDEFMSGEGKGIFVVSDELFDSEKLLNLLDRDNILGIIFSASLDQSLRHEIDSRRIPCFQMLQGQSLILETDGKSVWVRR